MSSGDAREADIDGEETADLDARVDVRTERLAAENRRLREEYARAIRSEYRRTALALAGVGVVAALGGILFADVRAVLFGLGGTGVFLGVLTLYLAPEQVLPSSLGRSVYDAHEATGAAVAAELGLRDDRVYVPLDDPGVRLFVPHHEDYSLPEPDALTDVFVLGDDPATRGVAVEPTGGSLYEEFEQLATGHADTDPADLVARSTDAVVDLFELVDAADPEVDAAGGRATVALGESTIGPLDGFDHPVVSVIGVDLATGLGRPVTVEVGHLDDDRTPYLVTYTWTPDGADDGT